jgi:hypothetical protein
MGEQQREQEEREVEKSKADLVRTGGQMFDSALKAREQIFDSIHGEGSTKEFDAAVMGAADAVVDRVVGAADRVVGTIVRTPRNELYAMLKKFAEES